jgi:hypothetical protein
MAAMTSEGTKRESKKPRPPVHPMAELWWSAVEWATSYPAAHYVWNVLLTTEDQRLLGMDLDAACEHGNAVDWWRRLKCVSEQRAVVDVARATGRLSEAQAAALIRATGERPDADEQRLAAAVAGGDLVVVIGYEAREAYWKGMRIDVDWGRRPKAWPYFVALVRGAKTGQSANLPRPDGSLDGSYLNKLGSKVAGDLLPDDLSGHIKPVGKGELRLDLPPQRVRLFERTARGEVRELSW